MAAEPAPFESVHAPRLVSPPHDERAAFIHSLVETMHATLSAEAARVAEDIERRREAFVAAVRSRREPMARRIHELANEDRRAIDAWAAGERTRIQAERERRAHEVQLDLETSLAEHDAHIEQEIRQVEAAIAAHRAEVAGFFASLARETDPVAIAKRAGERPRFPIIEMSVHAVVSAPPPASEPTVPAQAEVATVEETVVAPEPVAIEVTPDPEPVREPVPVMDPIAVKRAEWWAAWKALHEPPELSEVLDAAEQEAPSDLREAVTAGSVARPDQSGGGILITSIPILRPFNWLRRGRDADEGAHGTS
jgi:hypothetical protein